MKNKIILALTGATLSCLTPFALAATPTTDSACSFDAIGSGNQTSIVDNTPVNLADQPFNSIIVTNESTDRSPFYIKPTLGVYQFRLPGIDLPLTSRGATPPGTPVPQSADEEPINFSSVSNNKPHLMPELEAGYNFQNPGFLTSIFGYNTSVALSGSFQKMRANNANGPDNNMDLFALYGPKLTNSNGISSTETTLQTDTSLYNLNLLFKGEKKSGDMITYAPYTGIVYSNLQEDNHFVIGFPNGNNPATATFQENIRSNYIGVGAGTKVSIKATNNVNVFADGMAQLLYVHNHAIGDSNVVINSPTGPVAFPAGNQHAEDSLNKVTYRALLSVGSAYFINGVDSPNSVSISGSLGMEQWGALPEIINQHSASDRFHLISVPKLSTFAKIGINIPIA